MAELRDYNAETGLKKVKKISNQITLLVYKDRESLCKAFCRVEEYYESPEFAGKIFTMGEYRRWYTERYGAWTYFRDWSGFNIPSDAFEPFNKGLFDPLDTSERELVDLFKYKEGQFCVIGTFEGCDPDVYDHEICHALYATNVDYKLEVDNAMTGFDLTDLKKALMDDLGYNESVVMDECHAYICESNAWLDEKKIDYPKELVNILKGIKAKYHIDSK